MTVDYRGQRLLLETTPEKRKANELTARIEAIQQKQLVKPDTAGSVKDFLRLAEEANGGFPNIQALAKASAAALEWDVAAAKNDNRRQGNRPQAFSTMR